MVLAKQDGGPCPRFISVVCDPERRELVMNIVFWFKFNRSEGISQRIQSLKDAVQRFGLKDAVQTFGPLGEFPNHRQRFLSESKTGEATVRPLPAYFVTILNPQPRVSLLTCPSLILNSFEVFTWKQFYSQLKLGGLKLPLAFMFQLQGDVLDHPLWLEKVLCQVFFPFVTLIYSPKSDRPEYSRALTQDFFFLTPECHVVLPRPIKASFNCKNLPCRKWFMKVSLLRSFSRPPGHRSQMWTCNKNWKNSRKVRSQKRQAKKKWTLLPGDAFEDTASKPWFEVVKFSTRL